MRTLRTPATSVSAWQVLIAINAVVFLAEVATGVTLGGSDSGWVYYHGVLFGPTLTSHNILTGAPNFPVALTESHQYWRLLTAGFLHASIIHIGVNMLSLWFIGRVLEPAIGRTTFTAIYLASLLAGSFGALLFTPDLPSLGASTAIFGVFGTLIVVARARGIPLWQSGLAPMLLINLVFTLTVSQVSVGGHLGGLVGGFICGWLHVEFKERRGRAPIAMAGYVAVAVISVIAAIAVAGNTGLVPNGLTL